MAGENQIQLEILVEVKDSLKRLEEFEKKSAQSVSSVEKTFGALKAAAGAAVAVFAGKQVIDFFSKGVAAAEAQETAMRNLATALDQTGELSQDALDHFSAFANEMEATTKFGDDVVLSQVAIAKSFGVTNAQAEELVKTAADLAASTGVDLPTAVQQLGKTYSGATGKLDDMVPALKRLTKAQLENGEAVRLLAERYGGAAAAEIQTFSGAMLQAENAFGNFQEAIGTTIVDNPAVVASITGLKDVFGFLEQTVVANQGAIKEFIGTGLEVTAASAAGAAHGLAVLVEASQALTVQLVEGVANIADLTGGLLSFIPGAGDAAKALADFGDDARETAAAANDSLGKASQGFNSFSATVDAAAEKVFAADQKTIRSAKASGAARSALARDAAADAKELEKLGEAASKFETTLRQGTADEAANLKAKLDEQLASITEFESKKVISAQKAEELRVVAVSTSVDKIGKLHEDEHKKQVDEAKKAADEARAAVEAAAADPIKFAVSKLEIEPVDLSSEQRQVAAAATGILAKVLEGASGAKSLISQGAGAFADAFIPGIGGAVTGVIGKLAEGPDATKKFVKEFIESVPDIIDAIAESIPVVIETMVDYLVNHGGAVKIAIAIVKAMSGQALFAAIGRQIGAGFHGSVDWGGVGRAIGRPVYDALTLGGTISGGNVKAAFAESVESFKLFMHGDFKGAFDNAFDFIRTLLPDALKAPAEKLQAIVDKLFTFSLPKFDVPDWITSFTSSISSLVATPAWIQTFSDLIDKLTGWVPGGGGGGTISKIKSGGLDGNPRTPYARGGMIPSGFPNDTFPARLSSGELVVPRGDVERLSSFLDQADRGGGNVQDIAPLLIRIASLLEQRSQPIELKLDGAVVAKAVYSANYRNARLAR